MLSLGNSLVTIHVAAPKKGLHILALSRIEGNLQLEPPRNIHKKPDGKVHLTLLIETAERQCN